MLSNAHDVFSVPLQLKFNSARPSSNSASTSHSGDFLSRDSQLVSISHTGDDGNGLVAIATERPPNTSGVSGQGKPPAPLTLQAAIAAGDSDLTLVKVGARTSTQANLPRAVGSAGRGTCQADHSSQPGGPSGLSGLIGKVGSGKSKGFCTNPESGLTGRTHHLHYHRRTPRLCRSPRRTFPSQTGEGAQAPSRPLGDARRSSRSFSV